MRFLLIISFKAIEDYEIHKWEGFIFNIYDNVLEFLGQGPFEEGFGISLENLGGNFFMFG